MAEETLKTPAPAASVEVCGVPEAEKVETVAVCEKEDAPPQPEPEPETVNPVAGDDEKKVTASTSFKEETNVVGELPDPQKKALDELKQLVQEALNKHEFTAPPVKEEEKPADEKPAVAVEEEAKKPCEEVPVPTPETEPVVECKDEEKDSPAPPPEKVAEPSEPVKEVTEVVVKTESCVDEDGAKKIEAIQETIVAVTAQSESPATEETPAPEETPTPPEEISIWGIPLLSDERSDVILLKFLRARDFKVKDAFTMLKNVVAWRKEFGIESLLEEDLGTEQEKVVFMHGVDKEGHPVCYNAYGEYQNKELYQETFSDEEKRRKFLRWRIQFLEKSIRKLDFSPDGISTILQINDLKYSPTLFNRDLRQALQLLQDNYPEFVARQVFINVPWWYLAFYKMINPFFTQRTKSKFVFAGPSKTAETLFKYISPELVPVQFGGLSREGDHEFTAIDSITEEIIKPSCKHTIELPAPETCVLVWEARIVGSDVSYGAEFVPSAEDGYTVIVQKSRKIAVSGEESVICGRFRCGEAGKVVLTFDNQSSKKKKVLYRFKSKVGSD